MPILAVSDLTVQRGRTLLLDNLSWKVARGEHWVILGPNGSGKTSLLSALTGYLTPSAGRIELLCKTYAPPTGANCASASAWSTPPFARGFQTTNRPCTLSSAANWP